jgi:hypothetical protein
MKTLKVLFITCSLLTIVISGCNTFSSGNRSDSDTMLNADTQKTTLKYDVKAIFFNLPSPIEFATIIQKSGALYFPGILNPYTNINKYNTVSKQALNFGTFCTDLSYARVYDQILLSMNYISSLRKIYGLLNIPEETGRISFIRMEKNISNRDSLLQIVTDTYSNLDAYLKDNDQGNISVLVITGGWIEALYLSTHIIDYDNDKNREIINRIAEQKYSCNNLLELIKTYPSDENLKDIYQLILPLKKYFDNIKIETINEGNVTNNSKNQTTIKGKTVITFTKEDFKEIKHLATEIRKKIIE